MLIILNIVCCKYLLLICGLTFVFFMVELAFSNFDVVKFISLYDLSLYCLRNLSSWL